MKDDDKYILHCAGFYSMLGWLENQAKNGMESKVSGQTVFAHPLISRYFSLGIAKQKKYGKDPFLAVQPEESDWMSLIQWDRVCVRKRDMHLYFVSKLVHGDKEEYPDIPPFVFALSFDTLDKMSLVFQFNKLDAREYRLENNQVFINYHKKVFSIPVSKLDHDEPYLNNDEIVTSYFDLISKREKNLVNTYGDNLLEIEGEGGLSPEAEKIMKKMNDEEKTSKGIFNLIKQQIKGKK